MTNHLLVTTLGTTWGVVPEVYGIFTDFFGKLKPTEVEAVAAPETIWIITTQSAWDKAHVHLERWAELAGIELKSYLRPESDLANTTDVDSMRELIFRVVLLASESCQSLSCSLAGGRKTMSADMQEAARTFGCDRLLHVLSNGHPSDWPQCLREPTAEWFLNPLTEDYQQWLFPVVMKGSTRMDLLDVAFKGTPAIQSQRFPIAPQSNSNFQLDSTKASEASKMLALQIPLTDEIAARQSDAGLMSNFIAAIEADEQHENWRSLYRLPPRIIQKLRTTHLNETHRPLLQSLPKAELHCHIGGILHLPQQRCVADAIWQALKPTEQNDALQHIKTLNWHAPEATWRDGLKQGDRAANVAATFQHFGNVELESILFPKSTTRIALKTTHQLEFAAYELPGELSGSAVLSHPAAIESTVTGILENCSADNICYLELRGSPQKYDSHAPIDWLKRLAREFERQAPEVITIRFIWIGDRRKEKDLPQLIKQAARARLELPNFLVGLDLAGDEGTNKPEELAPHFLPAFEACLPITIHAGEGESAKNIWQAAYQLHADRIGHGLTLAEHPSLLIRFRDRRICLELCPTSNREVVGFRDPAYPQSATLPDYPLPQLWASGVPLTLCTDNIGISCTTLTNEYITAARMIDELSLWDALAMIKQAFVHAFADAQTRTRLLKAADQSMHILILNHYD
jgi:adenosine deaminase